MLSHTDTHSLLVILQSKHGSIDDTPYLGGQRNQSNTPPGVTTKYSIPWITATVFKPDIDEGETSSSGGKPKFPVIAFGIGWNSWTERYAKTLTMLASHGFIVIAPSVADRQVLPTSFSALSGMAGALFTRIILQ
jgi:hypothetical protein